MELLKTYEKRYVCASSLIESVIAITIITICLLIALKLYVTILDSRQSINNNHIKFQVDKLMSEMKLNPSFDTEIYDFKTYKIIKEVTGYQGKSQLKKVSYIVEMQSDTLSYDYLILKKK